MTTVSSHSTTTTINPFKVLIATPCFNNQLYTGYFHSMIQLLDCLNRHNIAFAIATTGNESLITRGRNYFVSLLLSNPGFTHLLFIDADITFQPMSIVRMIHSNKPIVGGAYPKKGIQWDKIYTMLSSSSPEDSTSSSKQFNFLQELTHDYAINFKCDVNDHSNVTIENGFMEVAYIATGFMLIQRHVLETMVSRFPELKFKNDVAGYNNQHNTEYFYSLFDCFIDPESKRYLSEDYAFCKRWLQVGGEIWLDITCALNHFGSFEFKGNFLKFLEHHKMVSISTTTKTESSS